MQIAPTAVLAARQAAGLTQAEVAHRAQIGERTYRRIETGAGGCNVSTLLAISAALGVPVERLVGDGVAA